MLSNADSVVISPHTLIVLCGPAGSGKSTFASDFVHQHQSEGLLDTLVVSSDQCRAMICDDITNQQVNRDTFDLFHYIIRKRLSQGRLTIADSTALKAEARQNLLNLARLFHFQTYLVIFNIQFDTCLTRDQQSARGRSVGQQVITYHINLLAQALQQVEHEGWQKISLLDESHSQQKIILSSH